MLVWGCPLRGGWTLPVDDELSLFDVPQASWSRVRHVRQGAAGSLDTDPGIKPMAQIFVGSKASWVDITDSVPQFAEMPPRPAG
jgi:hypothetical protein